VGIVVGPIVAALFLTIWEIYGEFFKSVLPEPTALPVAAGASDPDGSATQSE